MAAGKSSRINRQYKKKYRIRNWREYERGLRSRGDVTIWLSEDAIAAWIPPKNGLRGGQRRYSNLAIRTALTLRVVFGLPLRQTEGFLDSLLSLMSRDLKAPDHTTLSRRNQIVVVPPLTRSHDGPIDLIVDSTGVGAASGAAWQGARGTGETEQAGVVGALRASPAAAGILGERLPRGAGALQAMAGAGRQSATPQP